MKMCAIVLIERNDGKSMRFPAPDVHLDTVG